MHDIDWAKEYLTVWTNYPGEGTSEPHDEIQHLHLQLEDFHQRVYVLLYISKL